MKKLLITLSVFLLAVFSFTSCLKEGKTPDPGFDVLNAGASGTALLENPLDLYLQIDRAIRFQRDSIVAKNINQSSFTFKMGYISLTVSPADTTTYPKTIVLDFGSDTAKSYTGQMSILMKGSMRKSGNYCTLNYNTLKESKLQVTGTDTVFSQGVNASGSIVTRYNMHGGQTVAYKGTVANYSGRVIAKYNLTSNINVIDSLEINATDATQVGYRIHSVPTYKLQLATTCNYFNTGIISTDVNISGKLAGTMVYDYGYNVNGTTDGCDYGGALYIYSKINLNYQQQYAFYAKKFE